METKKKDSESEQLDQLVQQAGVGNLQAKEFMSRDVMVMQEGYSIKTAIEILKVHKISGAPVIKPTGQIIGILSSYDLLIQASAKDLTSGITYNKNVFYIEEDTPLKKIIALLYQKKFRRLPVVNKDKKVVGIVSRIDVLSKILEGR